MNSNTRAIRPRLMTGVAMLAIVVASSGCGWIKSKTHYEDSREANSLEIPPGLDRPDTSSATSLPTTAATGVAVAAPSAGRLPVPAADAYPRVGEILAATPDVTLNGRAEALSSYDVSYKGESFLLRVLDSSGGSRLVALSADGRLLTTGAAAELVAAIRSKF